MSYTKTTWVDGPGGGTPINAVTLNNIEDGIESVEMKSVGGWVTKTFADDGTSIVPFQKVFVDATGGAFGLVLPLTPENGTTVKFVDVKSNFSTNKFTINVGAGVLLMGVADDFLDLVSDNDFLDITYFSADDNWVVTNKP